MSYLLPLGPFHPALRGPVRLTLRVEDEIVNDVDLMTGYNERQIAERLTRVSLPRALHIVSHLCGVDSHAHTLAFCLALEQLLDDAPSERATVLRTVAAELERAIAHLEVLGTLMDLLGLERELDVLMGMRGQLLEAQRTLCGGHLITDYCLPLGVRRDLAPGDRETLLLAMRTHERRLFRLADRLIDTRGVLRRTVGIGSIGPDAAAQFGLVGPLARAAGLERDLRVEQPYAAYERLQLRPITQPRGDVYSRLVVLLLEALESIKLIIALLSDLPEGEWLGNAIEEAPAGRGIATVESARGPLRYVVESDGQRLREVQITPPPHIDRLLARTLLQGSLVDDVALIYASTAPCPACVEA